MITPSSIGLPPRFSSFRSEVKQRETIERLAIDDSRFLMLVAPPGTGKSVTGISLSLVLGLRTLYLTKTKSLQQQGLDNFSSIGLIDIVGHSNYPCANVSYDDTGELADLECEGRRSGDCAYRSKVNQCISSDLNSTNYSHWFQLYKSEDPNRLGSYDLLICDEAHKLPLLLAEAAGVKLFYSQIDRYLSMRTPSTSGSLSSWVDWSREALVNLDRERNRPTSKRDRLIIDRLYSSLNRLIHEHERGEFILCPLNKGVQFKPLNVSLYAEEYLFRGIPKTLLMSATLFREDATALGIPYSDLSYFEVQSAFHPRNRPILYFPSSPPVKIDSRTTKTGKTLWLNQIDKILEFEKDGKGIIQSRSYDRALELHDGLSHPTLIHGKNDARAIINRYRKSLPPSTLISPVIEEGEDLAYDLCDYVIIPKVPFLDYRDPYTAAMMKKDKEYGNRETSRSIIQMALRGSRAVDDFCRIWVVDAHWSYFQRMRYFYSWFRAAFRTVNSLTQVSKARTVYKG